MSRRIGRWVYNSDSTLYGEAGWHLTGSSGEGGRPIVIDFMPGMYDGEPGRGLYLGYNWPGSHDGWIVSKWCREAMRIVEEQWDEYILATLAGDQEAKHRAAWLAGAV